MFIVLLKEAPLYRSLELVPTQAITENDVRVDTAPDCEKIQPAEKTVQASQPLSPAMKSERPRNNFNPGDALLRNMLHDYRDGCGSPCKEGAPRSIFYSAGLSQ
jgi:hypothetical protein